MKLYRYMSLNEFFQYLAGRDISSYNEFRFARTNSKGICFLGEETEMYDNNIHNNRMWNPLECHEFLAFVVCDEILVEFDVDEEKADIREGYGKYALPFSEFGETDVIKEYSTNHYNKDSFKIGRIAFSPFLEWEDFKEDTPIKDYYKKVKSGSQYIPSSKSIYGLLTSFSMRPEIPEGYGWSIVNEYDSAKIDNQFDAKECKTIKLRYGNPLSQGEDAELFSMSFVPSSVYGDYPIEKDGEEHLIINKDFGSDQCVFTTRMVLNGNYPKSWESLRKVFNEMTNKFPYKSDFEPGEIVMPYYEDAFKLALFYATFPDFSNKVEPVVEDTSWPNLPHYYLKVKGHSNKRTRSFSLDEYEEILGEIEKDEKER